MDSLKSVLPEHPSVQEAFGEICYNSPSHNRQKHAYGLASMLYDIRNHIAIDSTLGRTHDDEVNLAIGFLIHTQENDLLLCDSNHPS